MPHGAAFRNSWAHLTAVIDDHDGPVSTTCREYGSTGVHHALYAEQIGIIGRFFRLLYSYREIRVTTYDTLGAR